jgi:ABC-type microcin C transport system duplicated ATPase subunit YejF
MWQGRDLLTLPEDERRAIRGKEIAMIFQDPMTSLNPVHTIGRQIGEMSRIHEGASKKEAARGPSSCSTWWASRSRTSGSTTTPTSSRAACASGR